MSANPNAVGALQAVCLALITAGTLVYTIFKGKIKTHSVESASGCVAIGLALGVMSSFLGIGGGMAGRAVNKRMDNAAVDKLFMGLMAVIIFVSVYNAVRYFAL